ncbi:MAG: F0F1 ATP synthase subunit A [Actinomycetales bacterium]
MNPLFSAAGHAAVEHSVGSLSVLASQDYQPPSVKDFFFPAIAGSGEWFTKPTLLLVLSSLIVIAFFVAATRRMSVVPGKLQFAGEEAYGFVRNGIARDVIGSHDFLKFLPYLFALFYFLLVNNIYGVIPVLQFPTMSKPGTPYLLAIITWAIFNVVGIRKHGFGGYLKQMTLPPGIPGWVKPLIAVIEFFSTVIVRPLTLSLRLFANMFAGHLILLVFVTGGEYLLLHSSAALKPAGVLSWVLAIVLTFFEALVEFLQAYIFTLLTALYIAGALADEH